MNRCLIVASIACTLAALDVEPAKLATADANPLESGTSEIAFGASWSRATQAFDGEGTAVDRGGSTGERSANIGYTRGLMQDLDAGASIGWTRVSDHAADPDHGSGFSDIAVGAKWRCWGMESDDGACGVALLPSLTVPTGRGQDPDDEIATASRCWTGGLLAACSGNAGAMQVNADAGYAHAFGAEGDRDGYRGTFVADAAIGWQVAEGVQPEIDVSWVRDRMDAGPCPWAVALTAGVQLGLPIGRLGMGVQRTVAGEDTDRTTSLLAQLAIPLR